MKNDFLPEVPVTVNWAVTNRCNFGCDHCYSRTDPAEELDFATICCLVEKLSRAKVFSINFGGGEPLLRKDLFDIALYATGLGIAVSMNSNGYLIDETIAEKLRRAGFKKVGISIDSADPEVHDRFRNAPGSHSRAVGALRHLKHAGIETSVSSVICKINIENVHDLISQATALEVDSVNFHNFKCTGLGFANRDALDLSPVEWKKFYIHALELKKTIPRLHISLEDPIIASLGSKSESALVKGSVCGKLSLNLKSNADITPCGFIPIAIGNLLRDDLIEIWKGSPLLEKMRGKTPQGKCRKCGHYADCLGGCSARAFALTGDINNPDPHCWEKGPDEP